MYLRDLIKFLGAVILAVAVFIPLSVSVTDMRGYWAVGGEIFIPMIIVGWGAITIFGGYDDEE